MEARSRYGLDRLVLEILRQGEPGTAAQLAARLDADVVLVAAALGRLRRKGLVRRAPRPDGAGWERQPCDHAWAAAPTASPPP